MATISKATLEIFIWQGNKDAVPTNPEYTLVKSKLSSEDIITFEVAELIKDYVDISFNGNYNEIVQSSWVKFKITREFDDDPDYTDENVRETIVAFTGYGEFEDGINPRLSNNYMISNETIFVKKGEQTFIPFFKSAETDNAFAVQYLQGGTVIQSEFIGGSVTRYTADTAEFRADTTSLKADATQSRILDSTEFHTQSEVPSSADQVKAILLNGTELTRDIRQVEECKHTPYKISFINKFGVVQDLWFFKRRDDSFSAEREDYKRSILEIGTSSVSYNVNKHSRQVLDIMATETIKMNTGFVTEDHNEVIKQLMVTEHCWIHQNGDVLPIVPSTTSFQEKKEVNEKLINFTVEFNVANNYIQDIR